MYLLMLQQSEMDIYTFEKIKFRMNLFFQTALYLVVSCGLFLLRFVIARNPPQDRDQWIHNYIPTLLDFIFYDLNLTNKSVFL